MTGLDDTFVHLLYTCTACQHGQCASCKVQCKFCTATCRCSHAERPSSLHLYLSTACLHRKHEHCQSMISVNGTPKTPASCMWCSSPCLCFCHHLPT